MSNEGNRADAARRDHEGVPPLSISRQIGHFITWKRAKRHTALLHEAGYLLLGLVSLATVTGLYFWLDAPLVAAAFTYLVVLVLLSLVSNFSSLIVLSFIGVCCLSYFFAPPIYSFRVDYPQDLITISAFVITSFVVNFLVTGIQAEQRDHMRTCETLRDANQRLAIANKALRIEDVERRRAEQALRESEYKLRQIFETVPSHLWSATPTLEQPTRMNQHLLDYFGRRFEDFQHRGWEAFLHPDDLPETAKALSHAAQTGTYFRVVHRLRRADGEYRWHDARGQPLRDQQGRIIQWYGLSVDIDEAKKAEDRLRRSEAHLAEAQRLSHSGASAYDATRILYWSEETYRIFGFDPRDGLPSREAAWQRIHPDDRNRIRTEAKEAQNEKGGFSSEFRIVLPDGTVKYIESIGQPVFSATGELVEVVATHIDVTERKRAEEALRESEARSRSVLDGIDGLVAVLAPNGELEAANRRLFEYFGRPLEWLKNWGTNDAVHPEDLPRVLELVKSGIASGIPFNFELRLRRFDGEYRWFENRHVPTRDDSRRITRWYLLLTDIEDRTRALVRLEQMQSDFAHMNRVSMMGELAASLSHEITQPIASARNNARAAMHFLNRDPPDLGEVKEALACLVADTDRAGTIIDGVRGHIKNAPLRTNCFDLNDAIKEVIALARTAIIKNRVSVDTRLDEGPLTVDGDRVQLQQVTLNLVLNAVEAMSAVETGARNLWISTEQSQSNEVVVAVRDSGPGLDPKNLERVFETFYTTKSAGTGMGLSISRSIIAAHGGRLWADVNAPRGAAFQFTLPGTAKDSTEDSTGLPGQLAGPERRTETLQQTHLVNGLSKVADDPIRERAGPVGVVGVGRDKDGRNRVSRTGEVSIEVDSRHSRHLDVGDQAGGLAKAMGCEEIGGRAESLDSVAQRPHEPSHGLQEELIIIDDRHQ